VASGIVEYADAGALQVTAGVDPGRVGRALDGILRELAALRDEVVSEDELGKAKAYLSGGLELRMEETGAVASWLGSGEILLPRILTVAEVVEHLEAVTAEDMLRVARRYLAPGLIRLALLGPFRRGRRVERLLAA